METRTLPSSPTNLSAVSTLINENSDSRLVTRHRRDRYAVTVCSVRWVGSVKADKKPESWSSESKQEIGSGREWLVLLDAAKESRKRAKVKYSGNPELVSDGLLSVTFCQEILLSPPASILSSPYTLPASWSKPPSCLTRTFPGAALLTPSYFVYCNLFLVAISTVHCLNTSSFFLMLMIKSKRPIWSSKPCLFL